MSMSQGHLPVGRVSWLDNSGWNRLVPKAYPTYYIWCPRLNAHYLIALIGPLILAMNAEGPCSNDLVQRLQSPKMNWNSSIPQIFWPSDPFVVILNSSECLRIKFWYVTSNLINLIILKKNILPIFCEMTLIMFWFHPRIFWIHNFIETFMDIFWLITSKFINIKVVCRWIFFFHDAGHLEWDWCINFSIEPKWDSRLFFWFYRYVQELYLKNRDLQ